MIQERMPIGIVLRGMSRTYANQRIWLENIIVGVIGAFLFGLLTGQGTYCDWNLGSFIVAVIGALVLLFILRLVRRA